MKDPGSRTVILVGFMGAGKTSVGRALSAQLGWPFEDLDDRVRLREGRSIEEIFRESGEVEFRRMEHAALKEVVSASNSLSRIVGLGGGAFVQAENAALLELCGAVTVFLDAPVEELWDRCQGDEVRRPLQRDHSQFGALYDVRRPAYLKAAVRVETTGKTVATVAAELISELTRMNMVNPKES